MRNPMAFDYSSLPEPARLTAQSAVAAIRDHAGVAVQSAIEIGRELARVRDALPHGRFGPWLAAEFPSLSDRHARRLMAVASRLGQLKSDTVSEMAIGTLALLAESDLSDDQFAEAVGGKPLTRSEAKRVIDQNLGRLEDGDVQEVSDDGPAEDVAGDGEPVGNRVPDAGPIGGMDKNESRSSGAVVLPRGHRPTRVKCEHCGGRGYVEEA